MEKTLRLLWKALVNAYDAGWELVLINMLWFILSFPIITLPITMAGMAYYTHELAHGESISWKDFFVGIKKFFWPSMRYLLANLTFLFLILFYLRLFGALNNNLTPIITGLIYGFTITWLLIIPFVLPLMIEQEKPSLRTAFKNSIVMYLKWPGITVIVIILFYILAIGSTYFLIPWVFLTASLCSFLLAYIVMVKAEESTKLTSPVKER
jgi:hypothetical protein